MVTEFWERSETSSFRPVSSKLRKNENKRGLRLLQPTRWSFFSLCMSFLHVDSLSPSLMGPVIPRLVVLPPLQRGAAAGEEGHTYVSDQQTSQRHWGETSVPSPGLTHWWDSDADFNLLLLSETLSLTLLFSLSNIFCFLVKLITSPNNKVTFNKLSLLPFEVFIINWVL